MSQDTHVINDNLLQIDNLITGLNYLYEEVETRKEELLKSVSSDQIVNIVKDLACNDYSFKSRFIQFIRQEYGQNLVRDVAFSIMESIDNDIEAFINNRVDARLEELGITRTMNSN